MPKQGVKDSASTRAKGDEADVSVDTEEFTVPDDIGILSFIQTLNLQKTLKLPPKLNPTGITGKYAFLSALIFHKIDQNLGSSSTFLLINFFMALSGFGTNPSHCW